MSKRLTRNNIFGIIMFLGFYFVFVTISFFNAAYVSEVTNNQIAVGYSFNISLLLAIVTMLITSYLIDSRKINAKSSLIFSFLVIAITYLLMPFSSSNSILVLFILNGAFAYSLPSFLDTFVLQNIKEEDYAFVRSFGSFGAAISYFVSSYIIGSLPFLLIASINAAIIFILIVLLLTYKTNEYKITGSYKTGFKSLSKSRNIILMFIIAFLTYGVIRADDPFTYNFNIEYAGLTPLIIGVVGLLSILFEGFVMNIYLFLRKYLSIKSLLYIASLTLLLIFATKYLFYYNGLIVSIGNIMFGIYVGFFVPIMIHVISKYGNNDIQSSLLSFYQIFVLVGGLILGTITTFIFQLTGFLPDIYLLHTIIVLISFIFIFKLKDIE